MRPVIVLLFTLLSVFSSKAQSASSEGNVSLNIKLYPIHSLVVNSAQDHREVTLEYKTEADYLNGVSSHKPNHINVYSTGGFEIKVKSSDNELRSNTLQTINSNTVEIRISNGENAPQDGVLMTQRISSQESTIVTSTLGTFNGNYNVEYKGMGANEYINGFVANQPSTAYNTNLTYIIIPK